VNNNEWNSLHVTDTQIGLLGEKYNSAITNLMLYLTNVDSYDFFMHFALLLKLSGEKPVSRDKSPLTCMLKISMFVCLLHGWLLILQKSSGKPQ